MELAKRIPLVLFAVAFKKNDYAVLFSLVLLLALSGFFKPYKSMFVNILDVLYSVDIFVLLSIRNTVDLEDVMQIIPKQSQPESGGCSEIEGYTSFALLLLPFYYLPALLGLVILLLWVTRQLYLLVTNNCMPVINKKSARSASIVSDTPLRARTQTVIGMNECEPSTPVLSGGSLKMRFSLKGRQPHIRLASRKKNLLKTNSSQKSESEGPGKPEEFPLQDLRQSPSVKRKQKAEVEVVQQNKELQESLLASTSFGGDNSTHSSQSVSDV